MKQIGLFIAIAAITAGFTFAQEKDTRTIVQPIQKLTGVVRDHDGKAIPYAKVWGLGVGVHEETETDPDGRYVLPRKGILDLWVYARQKYKYVTISDDSNKNVDLTLAQPKPVALQVLDSKGIFIQRAFVAPTVDPVIRRFLQVPTDVDGFANLNEKPDGVVVTAPGMAPQTFVFFNRMPHSIKMMPVHANFYFALTGPAAKKIGDFSLNVSVRSAKSSSYEVYQTITAKSFNGLIQIPSIPGKVWRILPKYDRSKPFRPILPKQLAVIDSTHQTIDIPIVPALKVIGRIVRDDGRPIAGANVQLVSIPGDEETAESKKDGKFTLLITPLSKNPAPYETNRAIDVRKIAAGEQFQFESSRTRFQIKPNQKAIDLGDIKLNTFSVQLAKE